MRIDSQIIFEIHRLFDAGWKERKIARHLGISRKTVKKYLCHPDKLPQRRKTRSSKLDPYRDLIKSFLEKDPDVKAPVVLQRLCAHGFDGKLTIVRNYLRKNRIRKHHRQAYIRFESSPGEQIQIDWGHFGSLIYGDTGRKLYGLSVVECYSRMLYVEFTHSQKQEALHQALLNAFSFFGGTPKEIVVDNMLTAVTERVGHLVRFNGAFLDFLRVFKIVPVACTPGEPHQKGKVENTVKYIRQNFWPLRDFTGLADVNRQCRAWLDTVANVRVHQGTGKRPDDRFKEVCLRPLPDLLPDARQTAQAKVHKDFAVRFDGNAYTVPPWAIGKRVTIKADSTIVAIYLKEKKVAAHPRSWERKKRIELPSHREQVKKLRAKMWHDREIAAFASLGQPAVDFLNGLVEADQPIRKSVSKLLALKDEYGTTPVLHAVQKAAAFQAFGTDYVENILYQEMTPRKTHPPVRLKKEKLNRIRLTEPSLSEYDAHVVKRRNHED